MKTPVKTNPAATISEAARSEIATQNKETARVMDVVQKEHHGQVEELKNKLTKHAQMMEGDQADNENTESARPKDRGDNHSGCGKKNSRQSKTTIHSMTTMLEQMVQIPPKRRSMDCATDSAQGGISLMSKETRQNEQASIN